MLDGVRRMNSCPVHKRKNIMLADEISGLSSSRLRAVYRAGCLLRHSVSGGEEPEPKTNIPRTRAK